jgi:signal transduction histidine kinase
MTNTAAQPVYFLLVDDLEENLVALEGLVRREGLSLLKARSGDEALELLLQHDVALALLDVQMPGMDGFELAELMRGAERTRRIPIIFLTAGSADQQRRFRGYEAGAVDFLLKPLEPDILRSKANVFFELYQQRQEVARLLSESKTYALALQEADRRKDEFLATLAHELRNPLAPILNAVQLLELGGLDSLPLAELHDIMKRQIKHMVRLIDDLLDLARVAQGKIKLQSAPARLGDIVSDAVETSSPLIQAGQHRLTVSVPDPDLTIHADSVRITQVLSNLLNNAAKYTPEGGSISLDARVEGKWIVFRVRDTGLGIPLAMLSRVFDMFAQVNQHLNRAQGGLGIGLSLVKAIVELHGGKIDVRSAGEGQGSEFSVRLPLHVHESAR